MSFGQCSHCGDIHHDSEDCSIRIAEKQNQAEIARLTAELAAMTEERDGLAEKNRLLTLRHAKSGHDMDTAGQCDAGCLTCAAKKAEGRAEGLAAYLTEAREFSRSTFGEGNRTLGVTKHIEKEIAEVRAKPFDLTEWIDIIILACDGYWRHGGEPEKLLGDMMAKLAKNKARTWPKPTSENEAVEHDRTHDDPLNPELGPEHREYWVRKVRTEAFQERESAYVKISQQLLAKYVELFPAYAWTDEQTAIDLMAAEIATLRIEKAKARAEGKAEDIAIIQKNAAYLRSDARDATLPYKQGVEDLLMMSVTEIDHGPSVSTVMADAEEAGKGDADEHL